MPKAFIYFQQKQTFFYKHASIAPILGWMTLRVAEITPYSQKSWGTDLILLLLLIGSMFAFMLGSRPLNVPDEARYCEIPREMLATHHFITPRINGIKYFEKPPLFYWIQTASLKMFGLNEWSCRAADAFIALLGCIATYITTRKLFNRKTAWFASLILSSNFLYFTLARVVTLDMTVSVCIALTLFMLLLGLQHPPSIARRSYFYGAYLFAALAVLTKGLIGIIFPGAIMLVWLIFTQRWRELKHCYFISGFILFLFITLPWHILVQQAHPEFFNYYIIKQQFLRYLTPIAGRYQPDWFYLAVLFLGLFPWSGFIYSAIKKFKLSQHNLVFLWIWALFILIFFSLSDSKLVPYLLPTFFPFAILIADALIHEQSPSRNGWIGWGTMIIIAIGLIIALPFLLTPAVSVNYSLATRLEWIVTFILASNIIAIIVIYAKYGFLPAFITQFICSVLFLFSVCATLPYIYMDSIKPLTEKIKSHLTAHDMVATYHYYYQDLPFYLNQTVYIVDWKGELEFGEAHEPHLTQYVITDPLLWQHWLSPQQVYLFVPRSMAKSFLMHLPYHFYVLGSTKNDQLLTNHQVN